MRRIYVDIESTRELTPTVCRPRVIHNFLTHSPTYLIDGRCNQIQRTTCDDTQQTYRVEIRL